MAADTENTQELTHELIKRTREGADSRNGGVTEGAAKPVETERKRIVKLKKKPPVDAQAPVTPPSSPAVASEKTARKVKVVPRAAKPQNVPVKAVEADEDTSAKTAPVTQAEAPTQTRPDVLIPEAAQPTAAAEPLPADEKDKTGAPPAAPVGNVSVFKETARPAVQAGRVGGKFIGPKPQRNGPGYGGGGNDGRKPTPSVGQGNSRRGGWQGGAYPGRGAQGGGYAGGRTGQGGGYAGILLGFLS